MMNFPEKVGTLEPGVTADVAVLELKEGDFEFNDGARQTRTLKQPVRGGRHRQGRRLPQRRAASACRERARRSMK